MILLMRFRRVYIVSYVIVSSLKRSGSMEDQKLETIPFRPLLNVIAALKITGKARPIHVDWRSPV